MWIEVLLSFSRLVGSSVSRGKLLKRPRLKQAQSLPRKYLGTAYLLVNLTFLLGSAVFSLAIPRKILKMSFGYKLKTETVSGK